MGGQRGEPLQFSLVGPTLVGVANHANRLQKQLSAMPELGQIDLDLQLDLPQLQLTVDRTRAAHLGLNARDIALAVNVVVGGLDVAKYNDEPGDGERYDIRIKTQDGLIEQLADLRNIFLRSQTGERVRLDAVAAFHPVLGAAAIPRYDLQYSANFFTTPTTDLGLAVEKVLFIVC